MNNADITYTVSQIYESGKSDGWYLVRHTTLSNSIFLDDVEVAKFTDQKEAQAFKNWLDNLYRKKV